MCNCYVRYLPEVVRFGLHYGAHNPTCPKYRVSGDPVDRAKDEEFRAVAEMKLQEIVVLALGEIPPPEIVTGLGERR